jgi:hypothetical protein
VRGAGPHRSQDWSLRVEELLDGSIVEETGEHQLRISNCLGRVGSNDNIPFPQGQGLVGCAIPDGQLLAVRLRQTLGHSRAHAAKTQKSDFHDAFLEERWASRQGDGFFSVPAYVLSVASEVDFAQPRPGW